MDVTNNGKAIEIKVDFYDAAILANAVNKGIEAYRRYGADEFADEAEYMVKQLNRPKAIGEDVSKANLLNKIRKYLATQRRTGKISDIDVEISKLANEIEIITEK
ncbi:hypothetical protein DES38_1283 [Streptohalobacillus salinus]|uniref:Uncharacterized protein n=1 Tax=Streptohalobacillus salinus TaxID=621096 RepID=A0A2V3VV13_9BACI|nr:hypothetical protein [Streptohalobacillus salinus]PXW85767.1 hypothetical protein DES38_1283 [Streptohalobacillus salinus]